MSDYQEQPPWSDSAHNPRRAVVPWSIKRAIEILDEAIERIGCQFVRASVDSLDWPASEPASPSRRTGNQKSRCSAAAVPDESLARDHDVCPGSFGPDLP